MPKSKVWNKVITTTRKNLEFSSINSRYQKDAERRDKIIAMEKNWRPQRILQRDTHSTWQSDQNRQYAQMQASLKNQSKEPKVLAPKIPRKSVLELREPAKTATTMDLCFISITAFKMNLQQKDNTVSSISLYKINREL